MDAGLIQRFRALLESQLQALVEEGNLALESIARDGGDGKVDEDAAPLSEMNQVIASSRNRERTLRMSRIRDALERLAEDPDEYGVCEVCDEDIPTRRMELMPWTTTCVRCQEKAEAELPRGRRHLTDYD